MPRLNPAGAATRVFVLLIAGGAVGLSATTVSRRLAGATWRPAGALR